MQLITFYILFFALVLIYIIFSVWGAMKLKAFLTDVSIIATTENIEAFKRLATWQMILVYPVMLGGLGAIALFGYCAFNDIASSKETVVMIGLILINWKFTQHTKKLEKAAWDIPAFSEDFLAQRDSIVNSWKNKMWPSFN